MADTEPFVSRKRTFSAHEAAATDDDDSPLPSAPGTPPPPAKRRFFPDSDTVEDGVKTEPRSEAPLTSPLPVRSSQSDGPTGLPQRLSVERDPEPKTESAAFDQQTFEAFVGTKVARSDVDIIRQHSGDSLERAVNMFFDGTYKKFRRKPVAMFGRSAAVRKEEESAPEPVKLEKPLKNIPPSRYVGAFGVEGWATCSGRNILQHGDVVQIERQKPQTPARGRGGRGAAPSSRRVDILVRFTKNGSEIGRLTKENAAWVSTLLDQRVCRFEGTVVYTPDVLRTNETVFLQLRAYLVDAAFRCTATLADDRRTGLFEAAESAEERELRLRQVALVKLFQEINLLPVGNAAAADQRQELLQAAEMDKDKDKAK
jgi:DNA repair protein RAD5